MRLDQLDKLQELVQNTADKIQFLKGQNARLNKENEELKKKINQYTSATEGEAGKNPEISEIILENERLKQKNTEVKAKIEKLIADLELRMHDK